MSLNSELIAIPSTYSPLDYLQVAQDILARHGPVVALGVGSPSKPHPESVAAILEPHVNRINAVRKQITGFAELVKSGRMSPEQILQETAKLLEAIPEEKSQLRPGYKQIIGLEGTRDAAARFVNHFCGGDFTAEQAMITFGSSESHKLLAEYFGRIGQKMMLIKPYYPVHMDQILEGKSSSVIVDTHAEAGYLPTEEAIEEKLRLNPEVGSITLVYPSNPSGKVLNETEAARFGEILNNVTKRHPQLHIILEEVYLPIVNPRNDMPEGSLEDAPKRGIHSIYNYLHDEARANSIVLISGSKSLSMAEERVGALLTHKPMILNIIAASKGNDAMAVPRFLQRAFDAGLRELVSNPGMQDDLWSYYGDKIGLVGKNLASISSEISLASDVSFSPDAKTNLPQGGMFYLCRFDHIKGCDVPEALQPVVQSRIIETENHFVKMLLAMSNVGYIPVAVAPGQAFGLSADDMTVRISCIGSEEVLGQGLNTIRGAIQLLNPGLDLGAQPNYPVAPSVTTHYSGAVKSRG